MANMSKPMAALVAFLACLWTGEWASRRALSLLNYYPQYISTTLKKMEEEDYISCKGPFKSKKYRITAKGKKFLLGLNPERYNMLHEIGAENRTRYEEDRIRRQSLSSVSITMAALSGFSVHPHDKPHLSIASSSVQMVDRPDFSALALPDIGDAQANDNIRTIIEPPTPSELNSIFNYMDYRYYPVYEPRNRDSKIQDHKIYRKRSTPVGCFYTRGEMLELSKEESDALSGRNGGNIQNIQSSSVAGILFTGSGAYKVYCTDNTAPKIRTLSDEAITTHIKSWSGNVYKRSIENIPAKLQTQQLRGTVLLGDKSYEAAISVLEQTNLKLFGKKGFGRERGVRESYLNSTNYNLIDIPETFYFPVIREALPVYSALIFPGFEIALRNMHMGYAIVDGHRDFTESETKGLYDGKTHDGRDVACMVPLKLDRIMNIIQAINSESKGAVIYCPEYEVKFYEALFEVLGSETAKLFEIRPIPNDFIHDYFIGELQNLFNYDGPFPINEKSPWTIGARAKGMKIGKKRDI